MMSLLITLLMACSALGSEPNTKAQLLQSIAIEAQGMVPPSALSYWLFLQNQKAKSFEDTVSLDPVTEKTLKILESKLDPSSPTILKKKISQILASKRISGFEMRHVAALYLGVKPVKKKPDFFNEHRALEKLYSLESPLWYTTEKFNIDAFVGLMAIPINIVGISDKTSLTDGFVLPPIEFLHHDELHAIGLIATHQEELARLQITPGSIEYYEWVLERVRFTKKFLTWADTLQDPLTRRIAKIIWFDAFHDYFQIRSPYRNFAMTENNLRLYLGRHLSKQLKLKTNNHRYFVPGHFLSKNEKNPELFNLEAITVAYREVAKFAGYDPAIHGESFWKKLVRNTKNQAYRCAYLLFPYEKTF